MEKVTFAQGVDLMIFCFGLPNGRCGIYDVKLRVCVITFAYHVSPAFLFIDLVDDEDSAAAFDKLTCEFDETATLEIEAGHADVQTSFRLWIKVQFDVL